MIKEPVLEKIQGYENQKKKTKAQLSLSEILAAWKCQKTRKKVDLVIKKPVYFTWSQHSAFSSGVHLNLATLYIVLINDKVPRSIMGYNNKNASHNQ